ncbi:hypothetical protein PHYPSEUDO_000412 [Phytophthora pseudosyringae]|uniref:Uncharacterized protein n=1 Tax=Phytophthora pseudosyringae TaxID=221518 RepID=A0A8T1V2X5_9STRA|nr:hypothetical protein PHYPSEUDO_000412 [Phytophthora pseudosyringae]
MFVRRWLVHRLLRLIRTKRDETIAWLEKTPPAASYRGLLFETGVHEKLSSKCTIDARRLGDTTRQKFNLEESLDICYFGSEFSAAVLESGPYRISSKKNLVSIDSFYCTQSLGQLLLFQITVGKTHPVKGDGLVFLLKKLGMLKWVSQNKVKLIFVVPLENVSSFKPQKIELKQKPNNEAAYATWAILGK